MASPSGRGATQATGSGGGRAITSKGGDAREGWMALWRGASSPVWQEEKEGSFTWVWPKTFLEWNAMLEGIFP